MKDGRTGVWRDEFLELMDKRRIYLLQELLDKDIGNFPHDVWLKSVAWHYTTLRIYGLEIDLPDEIMAELILEKLV